MARVRVKGMVNSRNMWKHNKRKKTIIEEMKERSGRKKRISRREIRMERNRKKVDIKNKTSHQFQILRSRFMCFLSRNYREKNIYLLDYIWYHRYCN